MAILEPTELRLYKSDSDVIRFAQGEGYLQVVDNQALVLVEEAIAPDDIDRGAFESRLQEARDALERAEEDSEERVRAEREVKRYEAFLEVGSGLRARARWRRGRRHRLSADLLARCARSFRSPLRGSLGHGLRPGMPAAPGGTGARSVRAT